jgi:hypothetical protein
MSGNKANRKIVDFVAEGINLYIHLKSSLIGFLFPAFISRRAVFTSVIVSSFWVSRKEPSLAISVISPYKYFPLLFLVSILIVSFFISNLCRNVLGIFKTEVNSCNLHYCTRPFTYLKTGRNEYRYASKGA